MWSAMMGMVETSLQERRIVGSGLRELKGKSNPGTACMESTGAQDSHGISLSVPSCLSTVGLHSDTLEEAAQLAEENMRLREALADSHREVDFGHVLALAREFTDASEDEFALTFNSTNVPEDTDEFVLNYKGYEDSDIICK
jgi:hypothetical protein